MVGKTAPRCVTGLEYYPTQCFLMFSYVLPPRQRPRLSQSDAESRNRREAVQFRAPLPRGETAPDRDHP